MEEEITITDQWYKEQERGEICPKVDKRTIIIEASLKRTEVTTRGGEIQQFHTKGTIRPIGGIEDQIIQNDIEYADDTQLLIDRDAHSNYVNE